MKQEMIRIGGKTAQGYEIPIGPVHLVFATTGKALIGCGPIDAMVFDKFFNLKKVQPQNPPGPKPATRVQGR